MPEELVPILHVKDGQTSAPWYARLGFEIEGEHRFAPKLPLYLFLRRGTSALHLSAREVHLTDPDGNRLRIGELKE